MSDATIDFPSASDRSISEIAVGIFIDVITLLKNLW